MAGRGLRSSRVSRAHSRAVRAESAASWHREGI
jgi:hypothetical protein